jgi:hypothetical protein
MAETNSKEIHTMADLNDLDTLLLQAGVTITQNSGPSIDPELTKMYADLLKDTHRKLVSEYNAKQQTKSDFEAFAAKEKAHILESRWRTRDAASQGIDVHRDLAEIDVAAIAASKTELARYFGPSSDARLANKLGKDNFAAYRFLKQKAIEAGIRC